MTKRDAKKLLEQGKRIGEIFPLTEGQECMIYKAKEWPKIATDRGLSAR